jgi:hypothetical protein
VASIHDRKRNDQLRCYGRYRGLGVERVLSRAEALPEQIHCWLRRDRLIFSGTIGTPLTRSIAGHVFEPDGDQIGRAAQ